MPTLNPIVDEVRAARDAIARSFDYDIERLGRAMRERQARSGRAVVRYEPRPPRPLGPEPASPIGYVVAQPPRPDEPEKADSADGGR